jgi:hypothetical protein
VNNELVSSLRGQSDWEPESYVFAMRMFVEWGLTGVIWECVLL